MENGNGESAAAAAQQADPIVVIAVIGLVGLWLAVLIAFGIRALWREGRALRRCPVCGADAVRSAVVESIDAIQTHVELQCGQCATWRRRVGTHADEAGQRRRLQAHQRRIRARAQRLESARRSLDFRAFIALLRSDIAGAEDFLALTRPPRAVAGRTRDPRHGDR